jgi:hypothetical protein
MCARNVCWLCVFDVGCAHLVASVFLQLQRRLGRGQSARVDEAFLPLL